MTTVTSRLIQRGQLDRMPKEVAEEMDSYVHAWLVQELDKMGEDPEAFMKRARDEKTTTPSATTLTLLR